MKLRHLLPFLICCLAVAYPLSYGPALKYALQNSGSKSQWVDTLYAPLWWVCGQIPFGQDLLLDYTDFWMRITSKKPKLVLPDDSREFLKNQELLPATPGPEAAPHAPSP